MLVRPLAAETASAASLDRGRGIGDAHRIDPGHVRIAFEQGERPCVERGREAAERARVDELGHDLNALAREPRADLLLACECRRGPAPHLRLAALTSGRLDLVRERQVAEDDDHPLPHRDTAAVAVDEATPARRSRLRRQRSAGSFDSARDEQREDGEQHAGDD